MAYSGITPNERTNNISEEEGQFFALVHNKASFKLLAGSHKTQINLSFVGDSGLTLDLTLNGLFQIANGATTLADVLGKITQSTLSYQGVTATQHSYSLGYDLAFLDTPNNWVYKLSLMAGDDSFTGSHTLAKDDVFQGMSGNDTLTGNKGNDYFDGGTGLDTLVFSGQASEYTIDWKAMVANPILGGTTQLGVKVTDKTANRDGVDQAIGVEYLKFSDATLEVGEHTAPVGVSKLYLGPNGHWYGVVSQNSMSIGEALLDAQGRSVNSSQGYVATIANATENEFVKTVLVAEAANFNGILLLGGTDRVLENDWRWLDGPEKNTSTNFVNWDPASDEPNHVYGGIKEDYLAINGNGLWVDIPSGNYPNVGGYVIEFSNGPSVSYSNEWVRFVGAAGDDRVYAINRSSDGVLWGSGTTSGSVGANVSLGQEDYILVKLDAGGNPLLTTQNGSLHGGVDESFASAIDASGNVYVTGYGGQFPNLVHEGVIDAYVAKYTPTGQLSWIKSFGGVWADTGRAIAIGGNGNIYITGSSDDSYTGHDSTMDPNSFLAIYSPLGEKIKYQTLGFSSGDLGYAIDVANDGSVYIGGALSGAVAQVNAQGVDGYLAKYTSSGEQVWVRLIGEQHREEIHALTVDESGAVYVAGVTEGSLGGDNLGGYDGFVAKYLPSGERLWVSHFGSSGHDYVASITIGSNGLIYVAGNADGAFDKQTPLGNGDAYVVAFNASGQQVGIKVFGSSEGDSANSIVRGPDGYLLVSGATWGSFGGNQNQGIIDGYVTQMKEFGAASDHNEWVRFVGAAGDDRVYAINRSSDGVLWGSGTTSGSVGANVSLGQEDYILVKLDAGGNPLLTTQNGSLHGGVDESFASAIDASGNVYVTGYGGQFPNLVHEGVIDAYVAKYTPTGQLSWIKSFGGVWADTGRAIAIGGNGNIYITGSSDDSYTGHDSTMDPNSFLAIYSPLGEKIKYQTLGFSSGDLGYAIDVANDGSVYIGGALSGAVAQVNAQGVDGYLAKYTSSGEQVWVRLIGEQHREEIHALTVDESGAVYVAGVTEGSLGGDNLGGYDGFVAKYLPSGERLWVSHFGSSGHDYVASITIGSNGLIYVAGNADGAFDKQTPLGNGDAYVVAFNASGQQVGIKVFGSSEGDSANSIVRGPDGYLLVSGATWGSFGGNQNQGIIDGYVSQMKEFGAASAASPFVQKLTIDPAGAMRSPKFYYDSETIDGYPDGWSDWYTYHPGDSVIETKTNTKLIFVSDWSTYTSPPHNAAHYPVFPVGANVLVRNVFEATGDFSSSSEAAWQITNFKQIAEWKDGVNGTVVRYVLSDREGSLNYASFFNVTHLLAGADEIVGSFGADAIHSHEGSDSVQGRGGNDTLTGGAGNDTLDGGLGKDVAVYAGAASNYVVASVLDGYTVTAKSGSEGVDFLQNIETLRFSGQDQKISNLVTLTDMLRPNQMAGITSDGVISATEIFQVLSDRMKFEGNKRNLDFSSIQLSPYAALSWNEATIAANTNEFEVRLTTASGENLHAKLNATETAELIQVTLRTATDTLVFNFDDAQSHTTLLTNVKLNNFVKSNKSISLASTRDNGSNDLSYVFEENWIYQKNQVTGGYTWTQGPNTANSAYSHGGYSYSFRDKDNSSGTATTTSYDSDKNVLDAFTVQYRFDDVHTGFGQGFDLVKVASVADAIDFKNGVYETKNIKVEADNVRLDAQSSSRIDPNYDLTTFIAGIKEGTSLSDVEFASTTLFLPLLLQAGNTLTVKSSTGSVVDAGMGDDTVFGGAGSDTIDGGDGQDTVVYALSASNYTVTVLSGVYQVALKSGAESTDSLRNVESLKFADQTGSIAGFVGKEEAPAVAKFWKNNALTPNEANKVEAVNLIDAIAILKMIVGLNVNSNNAPVSPYQAVAADYDQNGAVDLIDAIGVLKMVVGLNAPAPTWKYFDDAKLASAYNATQLLTHKAWSAGAAMDVSSTADSTVKLVGVLTGDVDGSWAG